MQSEWCLLKVAVEQGHAVAKFEINDDQGFVCIDPGALAIGLIRIVNQLREINREEVVQIHCTHSETDFITTISTRWPDPQNENDWARNPLYNEGGIDSVSEMIFELYEGVYKVGTEENRLMITLEFPIIY